MTNAEKLHQTEVDRMRKKMESAQAEAKHMKKSMDHAWRMLKIANDRLEENSLPRVWSDTPS